MAVKENQKLAEKIAKILESESTNPDIASIFAALQKINHRLDKLESAVPTLTSENVKPLTEHASQQRFSIAEAIADGIFAGIQKEKACTFEPNGKPCDHCAMCSSRGF